MQKEPADSILHELRELGSSLPGRCQHDDRTVPDGYFENLPARIQSQISRERERIAPQWLYKPVRTYVAALASLVLLTGIVGSIYFVSTSRQSDLFVSADELFEMPFFASYANLNDMSLFDMLLETGITAEEILYGSATSDIFADEEITDDMLDYLLFNSMFDSDHLVSYELDNYEHVQ